MRVIAVAPFSAESVESADVARFIAADAADFLSVPGVTLARLVGESDEPVPAAEIARGLGAEVALSGSVEVAEGEIRIAALLVAPDGGERASWSETLPLGLGAQVGQLLARATLLALGEDAAAPPESSAAPVADEAFLALCRAHRLLEKKEPDEACEELLRLSEQVPELEAARRMLLGAARVAVGSDRMPTFLAALERLAELRPDDSDALLALGDYRALHFDEAGARALFLSARDLAADAATGAQALSRLASLALAAEHPDEAIAHLRAAIKLVDDPALYAQLGQLLFAREPTEGLRMLTRAAVLAPEDATIRLGLARALREAGDDRQRAIAEALEALRLAEDDRELAEAAQTELNALLGE